MQFDPTPNGVTLFRVNALGFGASMLAMFGAMFWWIGMSTPSIYGEPIVIGIFGGIAAFTAAMYVLPALAPRRSWGYVLGWIQIALCATSGTGTLPTIPVLIEFAKGEVRDWFDRRPIDPRKLSPAATRAKIVALVGYYTVVSVLPFAAVAWIGPLEDGNTANVATVTEAVAQQASHAELRRGELKLTALSGPQEVRAARLTTGTPWELQSQSAPVALTVWASHCGPCQLQLNALARAGSQPGTTTKHATYALDCEKNLGKVRQKLGQSNISSEALCAVDGLEVDVLPTTVFFDARGQRRATLSGYHSADAIDQVARAVEALR